MYKYIDVAEVAKERQCGDGESHKNSFRTIGNKSNNFCVWNSRPRARITTYFRFVLYFASVCVCVCASIFFFFFFLLTILRPPRLLRLLLLSSFVLPFCSSFGSIFFFGFRFSFISRSFDIHCTMINSNRFE